MRRSTKSNCSREAEGSQSVGMRVFSCAGGRAFLHKTSLVAVTAGLTGSVGAFFLWSLDAVTRLRFAGPWLLWTLPFCGLAVALLYKKAGRGAAGGTGLILEEIQAPEGRVSIWMAPLILTGTLVTHLGGGSAGREGTALQIGGSLAAAVGRWLKGTPQAHPGLLMAGVAAGFGAVFGTPWAGSVFAVEVLRQRSGRWQEWPWCLGAALLADGVCQAWGGHHTQWPAAVSWHPGDAMLWIKLGLAAAAFGGLARIFVSGVQGLQHLMPRLVPSPLLRPVMGGLLVIGLVFLSGTRDYLGLGTLPAAPGGLALPSFFHGAIQVPDWAWAWKLVFTLATVSFGFKGGEVTPLFFMGAALGYSLGGWLGLPASGLASLGMVAVFGAAAGTPAACFLMGVELFGPALALPMAAACGIAALLNPSSIYHPNARLNPEP